MDASRSGPTGEQASADKPTLTLVYGALVSDADGGYTFVVTTYDEGSQSSAKHYTPAFIIS